MSTKKNKFSIYIYVVITIIGCVLACSSIVPNDYLKLVSLWQRVLSLVLSDV